MWHVFIEHEYINAIVLNPLECVLARKVTIRVMSLVITLRTSSFAANLGFQHDENVSLFLKVQDFIIK